MQIEFKLKPQFIGTIANNFTIFGKTSTNSTHQLAINVSLEALISGFTLTTQFTNITGGTICSTGFCTNCVPWTLTIPSPTPSPTPSTSPTMLTPTPTSTPTSTPTPTPTSSPTPTITSTSSNTPLKMIYISSQEFNSSNDACLGVTATLEVYITNGSTITSGIKLWANNQGTVDFIPSSNIAWFLLIDDDVRYSVQVDNNGILTNVVTC